MVCSLMPRLKPARAPKCATAGCRNRAAVRWGNRNCFKCIQRRKRERDPLKAAFYALRDHARARGIEFSISLCQFTCFAKLSSYVEQKGPFAHCLTVDRIDNRKGYVPGNIQALTRARNSEKRMKQDAARVRHGYAWNGGTPPTEGPWEELPDDDQFSNAGGNAGAESETN